MRPRRRRRDGERRQPSALPSLTLRSGSRQSGIWVLDQFTRWQSVNWDYSGRLQKAQMDVTELTPDTAFRL